MAEGGYEPVRQDFDNAAYEDDYDDYDTDTYDHPTARGRPPGEPYVDLLSNPVKLIKIK